MRRRRRRRLVVLRYEALPPRNSIRTSNYVQLGAMRRIGYSPSHLSISKKDFFFLERTNSSFRARRAARAFISSLTTYLFFVVKQQATAVNDGRRPESGGQRRTPVPPTAGLAQRRLQVQRQRLDACMDVTLVVFAFVWLHPQGCLSIHHAFATVPAPLSAAGQEMMIVHL